VYLQSVWVWPRNTGTEPWNFAVAGECVMSLFASFVSNCKRRSTVQTQLVIAAHGKYTLWGVQVYGS